MREETKYEIKKICNLLALTIGVSGIIALTLILIENQSFYVGVVRFIPESNQWIRITEIIMGFFTVPILIKLIFREMAMDYSP
ncbi:MAG: hypothetical protein KAJ49_04515 [Arcobacteraceae bacterium]|nr:hypothetical protein [Arcobacteraceae bacterium]